MAIKRTRTAAAGQATTRCPRGKLTNMNDGTRILSAIDQGDPHAAEKLLPLVYEELRKLAAARMAGEAPGNTLNPTALVHEAYLRLIRGAGAPRGGSRRPTSPAAG